MEFFEIKFDENFLAAAGKFYPNPHGPGGVGVKCEQTDTTTTQPKPVVKDNGFASKGSAKLQVINTQVKKFK